MMKPPEALGLPMLDIFGKTFTQKRHVKTDSDPSLILKCKQVTLVKIDRNLTWLIWKKVEEYLWLFETYGGIGFSLFLMKRLGKLVSFWG